MLQSEANTLTLSNSSLEMFSVLSLKGAGVNLLDLLISSRLFNRGRYAMEDVGMFMHWALGYSHDFSYHKSRGDWRHLKPLFFSTSATGSMAFDFDLGKVWKVEVWAFDSACFLPHSSEALGFWFTNTSTPPSAQVSSTPIWWGVHQQRHLTWAASLPAPWPCPMSLWSIKVFCHGHVMPVWCVFGTIAAIAAIGIFRTAWSKRKQ